VRRCGAGGSFLAGNEALVAWWWVTVWLAWDFGWLLSVVVVVAGVGGGGRLACSEARGMWCWMAFGG